MEQEDTPHSVADAAALTADAAATRPMPVLELPVDEGTASLPASLQVSIVTHEPDLRLLERCLRHLVLAIGTARHEAVVRTVVITLIDNSADQSIAREINSLAGAHLEHAKVQVKFLHGHGNIGYGAAHNLALHGGRADYHLVLNPDLELASNAIATGVRWLSEHPHVGAVAPRMYDGDGAHQEYTCRRYPAVLDLLLRGFAPRFIRAVFRERLERYEMRDVIDADPGREITDITSMSGACLLVRRAAIDATGGFDPQFFLYFEDYDWTVRLNRITRTAYLPAMHVRHHGGGAARKGIRHIVWFSSSAFRFYRKHGWKWL